MIIKSARTFFWLTFFFGGLGVAQFYLGRTGRGIMYICTIGGFCGILPLVDLFRSRRETEDAIRVLNAKLGVPTVVAGTSA